MNGTVLEELSTLLVTDALNGVFSDGVILLGAVLSTVLVPRVIHKFF